MVLTRRDCLGWLGAAGAGIAGCRPVTRDIRGGFTGPDPARGHRWRDTVLAKPSAQRRTDVLVLGGGVTGLAAARALTLSGVEDFALLELEPELVIFGSGASLRFPAASLWRSLIARHIGFETMDTAAACRTYNVLAAEGRTVVAALLIEPAAVNLAPGAG